MALIPGTLPSDTCYGTPQDLLELFAQYLDVPAFSLNSKVVFGTSSSGLTADVIWFDTNSAANPILKITTSAGGFVDYANNYATNLAIVTTPAAGDYVMISQTNTLKKITYANLVPVPSPGKIIQIVEGSTTTAVTNSSTSFVDTGLTVSITPTLSSNKVLILITQPVFMVAGSYATVGAGMRLLRGGTTLYAGDTSGGNFSFSINVGNSVNQTSVWAFNYLDSPSSSSSLTYKTQFYSFVESITCQRNSQRSSILAIEVTP